MIIRTRYFVKKVLKCSVLLISLVAVFSVGRSVFQHGGMRAPPPWFDDDGWKDIVVDEVLEINDDIDEDEREAIARNIEPVRRRRIAEELEVKPNVLDEHMAEMQEDHERSNHHPLVPGSGQDHFSDEQLLLLPLNAHKRNLPILKPRNIPAKDKTVETNTSKTKEHQPAVIPKTTSGLGRRNDTMSADGVKNDGIVKGNLPTLKEVLGKDSLQKQKEILKRPNETIITDIRKLKVIAPPVKKFDPANPLGEMGKPVVLEGEMEERSKALFRVNAFNLLASNLIAFNRSLPDVRPEQCKSKKYPDVLPSTSVIIIFHNEAFSALLRTVHSVINRSPRHLLKEIIMVDDASSQDHLKAKLDEYIARHFQSGVPVILERLPTRSGLIRARIHGAKTAKGTVLTFLDSHCEVTVGWLEPLLATIAHDRRNVVTPVIDSLDDKDLSFKGNSGLPMIGSFSWRMIFTWTTIQTIDREAVTRDPTLPLRSPTMAGGLFAIDRSFFMEIGMYDPGLRIWGAENLELSFKSWMCGGALYTMVCSHVGHIFRHTAPYSKIGVDFQRNTKRLVDVWLDEHARTFFYKMNPYVKNVDAGNVTEQHELRQKLGCKSFQWYLHNVFPESSWPRKGSIFGYLRNADSKVCLWSKNSKQVYAHGCEQLSTKVLWEFTERGELRQDQRCLDYTGEEAGLSIFMCHKTKGNQFWRWNNSTQQLSHGLHGGCLSIQPTDKGAANVVVTSCSDSDPNQKWKLPPPFISGEEL